MSPTPQLLQQPNMFAIEEAEMMVEESLKGRSGVPEVLEEEEEQQTHEII